MAVITKDRDDSFLPGSGPLLRVYSSESQPMWPVIHGICSSETWEVCHTDSEVLSPSCWILASLLVVQIVCVYAFWYTNMLPSYHRGLEGLWCSKISRSGLVTSEVKIEGYATIGYSRDTLVEWLSGANLFSNSFKWLPMNAVLVFWLKPSIL